MNIKELAEQAETYADEKSGAFRGEIYMRFFTEKFAKLVAAAEREACAKLCEKFGRNLGGYKAHEDNHDDGWQDACCEIETAIRARGEQA